ncbi:MAG: hypothetical protein HYW77_00765 [Parcubacteria group bacterium]|nr:hypothetical protein [Parcubacteria group bacterium]
MRYRVLNKNKNLWKSWFLVISGILYTLPKGVALAFTCPATPPRSCDIDPVTGAPLPGGCPITLCEIADLIQDVANFMLYASGFIMVIFLIWAGIMWMRAGGEPKKSEEARGRLKQGVIGAFIILGVGVILNTAQAVITREFFGF